MDANSEYHNASNMVIGNNPLFTKNELDWFDFETRVRRIIYDLLLPVNTRMKDIKDTNESSRTTVQHMDKQMQDFKLQIKHQEQRIRMIEEIGKRLHKLEEEQGSIDQKVHGITKNVINVQQQMMAFQGAVNVQIHTLEKNFNRQGFHDYITEMMDSIKNDYMRELLQQQTEKERQLQELKETVSRYENLVKGLDVRAGTINQDIINHSVSFAAQEEFNRKLKQRTNNLKIITNKMQAKLEGNLGLEITNKDMRMRVCFLENYLMHTVPIQTQAQITKTLNHALSSRKDQQRASQFFQQQINKYYESQRKSILVLQQQEQQVEEIKYKEELAIEKKSSGRLTVNIPANKIISQDIQSQVKRDSSLKHQITFQPGMRKQSEDVNNPPRINVKQAELPVQSNSKSQLQFDWDQNKVRDVSSQSMNRGFNSQTNFNNKPLNQTPSTKQEGGQMHNSSKSDINVNQSIKDLKIEIEKGNSSTPPNITPSSQKNLDNQIQDRRLLRNKNSNSNLSHSSKLDDRRQSKRSTSSFFKVKKGSINSMIQQQHFQDGSTDGNRNPIESLISAMGFGSTQNMGASLFQNLVLNQNMIENEIRNQVALMAKSRFSRNETKSFMDDTQSLNTPNNQNSNSNSPNKYGSQNNRNQPRNKDRRISESFEQSDNDLQKNNEKLKQAKNNQSEGNNLLKPQKEVITTDSEMNQSAKKSRKRRNSSRRRHKNGRSESKILKEIKSPGLKNMPENQKSKGLVIDTKQSVSKEESNLQDQPSIISRQRTHSVSQNNFASLKSTSLAKQNDPRRGSVLNNSQAQALENGITPMRQLFMNLKLGSDTSQNNNVANDDPQNDDKESNQDNRSFGKQSRISSHTKNSKNSKNHSNSGKKHHHNSKKQSHKKFKLLNQEKMEEINEDLEEDNSNSVSGGSSQSQSMNGMSGNSSDDFSQEYDDSLRTDSQYSGSSMSERLKSEFRQLYIRVQDLEDKTLKLESLQTSQKSEQNSKLEHTKSHIELVVETLRDEIVQNTHRWHRFKTDNELFNKELQNTVAKARDECRVVRENNENVLDLFQLMQESIKIMISLQIQDEKDRQSISLVGQKTTITKGNCQDHGNKKLNQKSQNNSPRQINKTKFQKYIELDPQCLSCSQNPTEIKTAYKMACLSYKPSNVDYKNQIFERQNLIQLLNFVVEETDNLDRSLNRLKNQHQNIMNKLFNRIHVWQNEKIQRSFGNLKNGPTSSHRNLNQMGSAGSDAISLANSQHDPLSSQSLMNIGDNFLQFKDTTQYLMNNKDGKDRQLINDMKSAMVEENTNQLQSVINFNSSSNINSLKEQLLKDNKQFFLKNKRKRHLRMMSQSSSGFDTYDMMINKVQPLMLVGNTPNLSPLGHQMLAPFIEQETSQLKQIRRQRGQLSYK